MLVRGSKFFLHLVAASLIGLVLISGIAIWQLSRGPISVGWLTPYVEQALTVEDSPVHVRLGDTVLTWAGLDRTLDVRAVGLDVVAADGTVVATVPEISVRFSARALLNGLIAPTSLELLGPRVVVVREADGSFALNMADAGSGAAPEPGAQPDVSDLIDALLARPDRSYELGYLTRIGISSALVEFEDRRSGMRLSAPRVNLAFERDGEGIRASGSVAVDVAGKPLRFQVSGILSARSGASELGLAFTDLLPARLAPLVPELAFLADIGMPVDGTVALSFVRDFTLGDVAFDLVSKGGDIALPTLFEAPRPVTDFALRGRARDAFRTVAIEEGRFAVDGATVVVAGNIVRRNDTVAVNFDIDLRNFAADNLARWWPETVARNARDWVTLNLTEGRVEAAHVRVGGSVPIGDPADFTLIDLDGRIDATGLTVDYLHPMEPVRGVNGVGTFDQSGFAIDVTAGSVRDMKVESARINISGLDGSSLGERISVELTAIGGVRGALELIDQKPLQLVRRVDVAPATIGGRHRTRLIVQLPLLRDVRTDDVRVAAASSIEGFSMTKGPLGLPIANGTLSLQVDPEKMIVDGNLTLAGVPAGVAWTERFTRTSAVRRTYQVRAIVNDAARAKLGIDSAPWVVGPVGIGLTYSEAGNGAVSGAAEIDLTSATMAVADAGWRKTAGIPGRAYVSFSGDRDHIRRIDRFSVAAADLIADGELALRPTPAGQVEPAQLTLSRLAFGNTDITAAAEFAADGAVDVSLGGRQLDLRREIASFDDKTVATSAPAITSTPPPVRVRISDAAPIGTVRLGETTTVDRLSGTLKLRGGDVRAATLRGLLNGESPLRLDLVETDAAKADGARTLQFVTDDGGAVFAALDLTDTVVGGRLSVNGDLSGSAGQETFVGQLDLTDFRLTEASSVSRALTLASFSGISDAIAGRGIALRRAEVPVRLTRDEIVITDAKLRGADIGVLTTGRIDRRTDTVDLAGEVAPAYTLNSLLGNIPLIGTLLTGGGDGIFAASFSVKGPIDDPNVSVNPLTVLTPGIIRRLLTGFGSDETVPAADEKREPAPPGIPPPGMPRPGQ